MERYLRDREYCSTLRYVKNLANIIANIIHNGVYAIKNFYGYVLFTRIIHVANHAYIYIYAIFCRLFNNNNNCEFSNVENLLFSSYITP